jgi:hypothetical protein
MHIETVNIALFFFSFFFCHCWRSRIRIFGQDQIERVAHQTFWQTCIACTKIQEWPVHFDSTIVLNEFPVAVEQSVLGMSIPVQFAD